MTAPRIGVTGVVRTWNEGERAGVNAAYVHAVHAAGGVPLILPPLIGATYAAHAVEGIDGLLFTGGEDVDPALYQEQPSPWLETVSRDRDLFELALFAAARQRHLPMLGICRGIQLINVALGGTLYQDIPSQRPNSVTHNPETPRAARTHGVRLEPDSLAAAALGRTSLLVNSVHHQGIKDLAPGLRATAWADDDLIEAIELTSDGDWLLAVQWHPEEMHADRQAPDRGLFKALVQEASMTAARRSVRAELAERSVG